MTTTLSVDNPIYSTEGDERYSGVVAVVFDEWMGSGTLLYDGRAVLTAAHVVDGAGSQAEVRFDLPQEIVTITSSKIEYMSTYNSEEMIDDVAIVWLSEQAPQEALRSELYRDSDEVGQTFSYAGFGRYGTGLEGGQDNAEFLRLSASNTFDAQADTLTQYLEDDGWTEKVLVADFDNSNSQNDALGELFNIEHLGLGDIEGMSAPGDSGGPAFLDSKVAGVISYGISLESDESHPDIDDEENETFGEMDFLQRVSSYQEYIDKSLRKEYQNQPTSASEVKTEVQEADFGEISVNYFLLEFNGVRENPDDILSLQYNTRDGSAKAGEDYIAVSGTINMYAGETSVLIPVEILGDNASEEDETFYLDVFDPDTMSNGVSDIMLSAQRTIINDDLLFFS